MSTNIYYVYCYLDEKDVPYYIGKGKKRRIYQQHLVKIPEEKNKILFLHENLDEEQALWLESFYINFYGRSDLRKGPLLNRTDGGDGGRGLTLTEEQKAQRKGKNNSFYGKTHTDRQKENGV